MYLKRVPKIGSCNNSVLFTHCNLTYNSGSSLNIEVGHIYCDNKLMDPMYDTPIEGFNLQKYMPGFGQSTEFIKIVTITTNISHNKAGSSPAISTLNSWYMNYTSNIGGVKLFLH